MLDAGSFFFIQLSLALIGARSVVREDDLPRLIDKHNAVAHLNRRRLPAWSVGGRSPDLSQRSRTSVFSEPPEPTA